MNGAAAKRARRAAGWTPLERERTYALRQLEQLQLVAPQRLPWWRRLLSWLRVR